MTTASAAREHIEQRYLGTVIDQQRMQDMPLNGRDPMQLMLLVAGVVATSERRLTRGSDGGRSVFRRLSFPPAADGEIAPTSCWTEVTTTTITQT